MADSVACSFPQNLALIRLMVFEQLSSCAMSFSQAELKIGAEYRTAIVFEFIALLAIFFMTHIAKYAKCLVGIVEKSMGRLEYVY